MLEVDWRSHDERSADYMGIIILLRMLYLDADLVTRKRGDLKSRLMLRFSQCYPSRAVA